MQALALSVHTMQALKKGGRHKKATHYIKAIDQRHLQIHQYGSF